MATEEARIKKLFFMYMDSIKTKSMKWTIKGESKWGDRRIDKYLKYFCLPISPQEVIGLLDTTVLRSAKEGLLFTTEGIVVKEVAARLYYLEFSKVERAEVLEERDEYYNLSVSLWVYFKDGTKKQIFDYYINRYFFVEYINAVVSGKEVSSEEEDNPFL